MSSLINALHCRNEKAAPIWLMRQAGRYLPEYRALKKDRRLYELFHDVEAIVKATLLPIDLLQVDAAILFSDILTVLDGLSIHYDFVDGVGPVVYDHFESIRPIDPREAYPSVIQAVQELKKTLSVPLLGFAGAPFTIACYMIEKKTSKDQVNTKKLLFKEPERFQKLLDQLTDATIEYLHCQIDAGVDAVQLFDSWASALNISEFRTYCLKPMKKITESIKKRGVPIILFCRGSCLFAEELASIEPSAISVDWSGDLKKVREAVPAHIALQGNLDPMILYGDRELIRTHAAKLLDEMQGEKGYIFNLGHGLLPDIPADNVKFLVEYVHSRS